MKNTSLVSKRSLHEAYETGKRGLNWADRRIRKIEDAFNIAGPVIAALQPDLAPVIGAAKAGFMNYNIARALAIGGDKIIEAATMD